MKFALIFLLVAGGCGEDVDRNADIRSINFDSTNNNTQNSETTQSTTQTICVPMGCAEQCGEVENGCGETIDCECVDEERLEALSKIVDAYVHQITDISFATTISDFDSDKISIRTREIIREYNASDAGLIAALRHAMLESRIGHAAVYDNKEFTCTNIKDVGDGSISRHGACAVHHPEGFVITNPLPNLLMGLNVGDLIVGVDGQSGEALVQWSLNRPLCGAGAASTQARYEEAARSFFSSLPRKTLLSVVSPNGRRKEIEVTEPLRRSAWMSCQEPLGRNTRVQADAYMRADGIGVIRRPSFYPLQGFDLNQDIETQMEALKQVIQDSFDTIKSARAVIWDVRSNSGGASPVAFAIAGGMPGFRPVGIARCTTRRPNTEPPTFFKGGPDYDLVSDLQFKFDGPVAILTDGRTVSAGDYFARAVKLGTDAIIVGTPTSGAFGGSGNSFIIDPGYDLLAAYDPFRCNDLDGNALETHGVQPDIIVHYDPKDLEEGKDTILERAVEALLEEITEKEASFLEL